MGPQMQDNPITSNAPVQPLQQSVAPVQTISLDQMSPEDIQRIKAETEKAILNQITAQQIQTLQAEAKANILSQMSAEQMKQLQTEAESAILQKIIEDTLKEMQVKQDFLATSAGLQRTLAAPAQMFPHPNIMQSQQQSIGSHEDVSKITMEKSHGSKREFIVHDQQGHQVNFCEQYDITGRSAHSGSLVVAPIAVQRFPPHTLRHVDVNQLQQYNRSQHSDTSSSIHSGATSCHSAASFGDHSGNFRGLAGTRQVVFK